MTYLTTSKSIQNVPIDSGLVQINNLTDDEISQLTNINTTVISTTQWGYLGAFDQGLTTSSSPTFNDVYLTGGDLIFTNNSIIHSNTSDGSDNKYIQISGGGAIGTTRGGYIELYGNEEGVGAGAAVMGTGGTAPLQFRTSGNNNLIIYNNGKLQHTPVSRSGASAGAEGILFEQAGGFTYTNSSTAASGTATLEAFNTFPPSTLAATNSSVTTTNAATVFIGGAPIAGTNQTITNSFSLLVNDGATKLAGNLTVSGKVIFEGITSSSGNGAVSLTGSIHHITSTATGNTLTLADGTVGQRITVVYITEGAGADTVILTPTNFVKTNITFNTLGDTVELVFTNSKWYVAGYYGAVIA